MVSLPRERLQPLTALLLKPSSLGEGFFFSLAMVNPFLTNFSSMAGLCREETVLVILSLWT